MGEIRAGEVHVFPLRVYYEDTDAAGIVYYANYLKFAERARSEFLRDIGTDNRTLRDSHGVQFAVSACDIRYRRPAVLDDALEVRTELLDVGGASMAAKQVVCRDGAKLVEMTVRLACIGEGGRPARMPSTLRSALASFQKRA